jgi:hypothetical protein
MGYCTRRATALVLALATSGCVTGHVLDAARRWERPATFEAASLDGGRLVLRYHTLLSDDDGTPRGVGMRRVVVPVDALRQADVSAMASRVEEIPDRGPLVGQPLPLVREVADAALPSLEISESAGGGPARLVLHDGQTTYPPIYANAFARSSTAPWAYPVLPAALAVDAVGVPVLLFFAPAVLVTGD